MKVLFFLLLLKGFFLYPLYAHEKEKHKIEKKSEEIKEKVESFSMPSFKEAIFEHLHNKLIHFPIALCFLSFLFLIISFKYPEFEKSARITLLISAFFTIPVYFSGENQIKNFEKDVNKWLAETHEQLGIFTIISIWLWLFVSNIKGMKKIALFIGILTVILISITAFYGGILAH